MTLNDAHALHQILSSLMAAYQFEVVNRDGNATAKQKSDDGNPMFTPQNIAIDRLARAIRDAEERGRQAGLREARDIVYDWEPDIAVEIEKRMVLS